MENKKVLTERRKGAEKVFTSVCLMALMFFSCSKREEKIPPDIISKEKMTEILIDVHLAEVKWQINAPSDNAPGGKQSYYKYIFNKHHISYDQLIKSYKYYSAHPEVFSKIYDDVITGLSKKEAELAK
jgi:hypothetical protein